MTPAHLDDNGASHQENYSWMDQYTTDEPDSVLWLGYFAGFGTCFVLACLGIGAVIGMGWCG